MSDAEQFAKYLIGQAPDGLEHVGTPHQVIHGFVDDWKGRHGKRVKDIRAKLAR